MSDTPHYLPITVKGLALDPRSKQPVLLLQSQAGRLILPIWIGKTEAAAIASRIGGTRPSRPLCHDLLSSLLERLGARVVRLDVRAIEAKAFHGDLCVRDAEGRLHRLDCRPSDGIALALRAGAPLRASTKVLEVARLNQDEAPPSLAIPADDTEGRARLVAALAELDPELMGRFAV